MLFDGLVTGYGQALMPVAAINVFGYTTPQWSQLVAVMGLLGAGVALALGPLIDKFGAKRSEWERFKLAPEAGASMFDDDNPFNDPFRYRPFKGLAFPPSDYIGPDDDRETDEMANFGRSLFDLNLALLTFGLAVKLQGAQSWGCLYPRWREFLADYAVTLAVAWASPPSSGLWSLITGTAL